MKFDKLVQTEVVEFEGDRYIQQTDVSTQTSEHLWKMEEDKCPTRDDLTDGKTSKRDYLRNMWKDTQTERKEIDHMKRRGHEVRNNLEKRLQVINQFVRKTLLQKEPKEPPEKTNLGQRPSKDTTCHADCKIDHDALDEKYAELEQLKVRMLSEIDKLRIRERVSARTTSDKGNQTFQVDATVQVTEQASSAMHQEADEAPETSSGLLCQIRHYCYRCCCPCCSCCQQVCPEET
ncbi:hypothetical protein GBF38_019098 [Nibea albiflora]|uniref:Uncharacterized protein n=1 Tax=Nibea albiflora TaxID=240163 RepID=A0ACB7F0V6_NIBAL|nr:hypothetical protein GBF38_019098 [Nibea albiflora]